MFVFCRIYNVFNIIVHKLTIVLIYLSFLFNFGLTISIVLLSLAFRVEDVHWFVYTRTTIIIPHFTLILSFQFTLFPIFSVRFTRKMREFEFILNAVENFPSDSGCTRLPFQQTVSKRRRRRWRRRRNSSTFLRCVSIYTLYARNNEQFNCCNNLETDLARNFYFFFFFGGAVLVCIAGTFKFGFIFW